CCLSHAIAHASIYTLSLHDALPISQKQSDASARHPAVSRRNDRNRFRGPAMRVYTVRKSVGTKDSEFEIYKGLLEEIGVDLSRRSEEHTSELQSLTNLVCRLLLQKK